MSWRDRLRTASFRGVEFLTETVEGSGSRRLGVHDLPGGLHPRVQDLGRGPRRYTLDGYLLGEDYLAQLDELQAALERPGPGTLVHPYRGSRTAHVGDFRVRHSSRELRMARLQIEFVEVAPAETPAATPDPLSTADAAGEDLEEAAEADLVEGLGELAGQPEHVSAPAVAQTQTLAQTIQGLSLHGPASDVSKLLQGAAALADQAIALVSKPADLAREGRLLLGLLEHAVGSRLATLGVLAKIYGLSKGPGSAGHVHGFFSSLALGSAVGVAARVPWESRQQAEAEAQRWAQRIDGAILAAPDASYDALLGLRRALALAVPPPGKALPELRTLILDGDTGVLPLAYRLYDDAARGREIARRNGVRHPGLLEAGLELEVLSA